MGPPETARIAPRSRPRTGRVTPRRLGPTACAERPAIATGLDDKLATPQVHCRAGPPQVRPLLPTCEGLPLTFTLARLLSHGGRHQKELWSSLDGLGGRDSNRGARIWLASKPAAIIPPAPPACFFCLRLLPPPRTAFFVRLRQAGPAVVLANACMVCAASRSRLPPLKCANDSRNPVAQGTKGGHTTSWSTHADLVRAKPEQH